MKNIYTTFLLAIISIAAIAQYDFSIEQHVTGGTLTNGIGLSFTPSELGTGSGTVGDNDTVFLKYVEFVYSSTATSSAPTVYLFSTPPDTKAEMTDLSGGILIDSSYSADMIVFPYDRYYFDSIPLHKDSTYYVLYKDKRPLEAASAVYDGGGAWAYSDGGSPITLPWGNLDARFNISLYRTAARNAYISNYYVDFQSDSAEIDSTNHTISIELYEGEDISSVTPQFSISNGATITPGLNEAVDFSSGSVTYEVIAEDTNYKQVWTVSLNKVTTAPWPLFKEKGFHHNENTKNLYSMSWGDLNGDNYPDLVFGYLYNSANRAYINNRDGRFTELEIAGLNVESNTYSTAILDINNDNLNDILAVNGGFLAKESNTLLLNTGNGNFIPVACEMTDTAHNWVTSSFTDADNDGNLDIFISRVGAPNQLYRNYGNANFQQISAGALTSTTLNSYEAAWGDYNSDGLQDAYVSAYKGRDKLYANGGNANFTSITSTPIDDNYTRSNTAIWADIDNDMDLDLYVLTYTEDQVNKLYINNGDGTFTTRTDLPFTKVLNCGNANIIDIDNNGYLDVIIDDHRLETHAYLNFGDFNFQKVVTGSLLNDEIKSWADYNNDGFLDAYCKVPSTDGQNFILENPGNNNHWLSLNCIGTVSNSNAIGTKIKLKANVDGKDLWQYREISSEGAYLSAGVQNTIFGLGDATTIDSLIIIWPSGIKDTLLAVNVDTRMTITEDASGAQISTWTPLNSETEIHTFSFENEFQPAEIDSANRRIDVYMEARTNNFSLVTPNYTHSALASASPMSGSAVDFSSDTIYYTVTAENNFTVSDWMVVMNRVDTAKHGVEILSFEFDGQLEAVNIDSSSRVIRCSALLSADLSQVIPAIEISPGATLQFNAGDYMDLSVDHPILTVTAEDTTTVAEWEIILWRYKHEADITYFWCDNMIGEPIISIEDTTVTAYVGTDSDLNLSYSYDISEGAFSHDENNGFFDFSQGPLELWVNGDYQPLWKKWTVNIERASFTSNEMFREINIYPNPTNGEVNIESETTIDRVEVVDISGKLTVSENFESEKIQLNVSELDAGNYFVKVISGKNTTVKNLVIQ